MSQHNERFATEDLGQHTAEYDREIGELRLSWSGSQTFLSQAEAEHLRNLLNRELPARMARQASRTQAPALRPEPAVLESQTAYQDQILSVLKQRLRLPDGREVARVVAELPPRVLLIPVRADGVVLLIEEYNYGAQRWQLTLPGGKVSGAEDPAIRAGLEVREETGYRADQLSALISWHSDPGVVVQQCHVFVARQLTWDPLPGDKSEQVYVHSCTLSEALALTALDYQWDPEAAFAIWLYASTQGR